MPPGVFEVSVYRKFNREFFSQQIEKFSGIGHSESETRITRTGGAILRFNG